MADVIILLTSYNGSRYIRAMIDSIISQDYSDWQLILSDDGSSDGTDDILEEYASKMPGKIIHYRSGRRFGNAQDHFMHLLCEFHRAPYIMFCDQDDKWHSDKISKTLAKMKQIQRSVETPALVYTDLRVVDQQMALIDPSFMHYAGLDGGCLALNRLLVRNTVTGCTMMVNQKLAQIACRIGTVPQMRMHDWWLALIAATCGELGYLDEATIDYRIHAGNAVGAKNNASLTALLRRAVKSDPGKALKASISQAEALLASFGSLMKPEAAQAVQQYVAISGYGVVKRRVAYLRGGYLMDGMAKRIGQMFFG